MEAEAYPQEIPAEDEPRYLRRQKPLGIKRRKFGRKAWKTYLRVSAGTVCAAAGAWVLFVLMQSLRASPALALAHPDQVALSGNRYVSRPSVLEFFRADRNVSVLRIPVDERRRQIESLPWVESAVVRRALPNRIQVEIVERTPIAFLRQGSDLMLVDGHGFLLDTPAEGDFHFPVVTGITASMPQEDRESRMQLYAGFLEQIDAARPGSSDAVSEVDLSDAEDLRATFTSLPVIAGPGGAWAQAGGPLLVHFGESDFRNKYQTLLDNIGQWRAAAGRFDSLDLRFSREVVANPQRAGNAAGPHATGVRGPSPPLADQDGMRSTARP